MMQFSEITEPFIGAAIAVHRALGPGLLEAIYEECLAREMTLRGIRYDRQAKLPIHYRGELLPGHYRADFVVEDKLIAELKVVAHVEPVHRAQLLSYLRLSNKPVGLLINFYVPVLKDGIERMVNSFHPPGENSVSSRLRGLSDD